MPFDGKTPMDGKALAPRSEWRGFLIGLFGILGFAAGMAVLSQELAW